jgi:hypothetical protein
LTEKQNWICNENETVKTEQRRDGILEEMMGVAKKEGIA